MEGFIKTYIDLLLFYPLDYVPKNDEAYAFAILFFILTVFCAVFTAGGIIFILYVTHLLLFWKCTWYKDLAADYMAKQYIITRYQENIPANILKAERERIMNAGFVFP